MRKIIILLIAGLACASCKTSEERRADERQSDRDYCNSIGATNDKFTDCMMQKDGQRARAAELAEISNQQNQQRVMDQYRQSKNHNVLTNVSCPASSSTGVSKSCLVY